MASVCKTGGRHIFQHNGDREWGPDREGIALDHGPRRTLGTSLDSPRETNARDTRG
jgi:hypothetical protein